MFWELMSGGIISSFETEEDAVRYAAFNPAAIVFQAELHVE